MKDKFIDDEMLLDEINEEIMDIHDILESNTHLTGSERHRLQMKRSKLEAQKQKILLYS